MHTIPLYYCCLTPYDASFTGVHILFDKELVQDTLGETVSKAGKHQLRIAETEKYAHVTFFFNGGRETEQPPAVGLRRYVLGRQTHLPENQGPHLL